MTASGFAGVWDTDFGELEIEVDGVIATGEFGEHGGTIEGIANGLVLQGKWTQRAAGGFGITWGEFRLTLHGSGQSFTGTWNYKDDHAPEGGTWNGTRVE